MKSSLQAVLVAVMGVAFARDAFAMTNLKQVQISGGSQIDLVFDGKVGKKQIQAEYFNDIIQINLKDVSVYPAKISSISGGNLLKIFAYQYAPKLVRCRITVKGKAETYRDKLQLNPVGKVISLKLDEPRVEKADTVTLPASAPVRSQPGTANAAETSVAPAAAAAAKAPAAAPAQARTSEAEEKALLERVMNSQPVPAAAPAKTGVSESHKAPARPLPGIMSLFVKLAGVVLVFCLFAFLLKRFFFRRSGQENRLVASGNPSGKMMRQLGKFARDGLGILGGKEKMIEVLSTHYLGPKKSIVVVKVCGRVLVLGVSQESINLITQLADEVDEVELDQPFAASPTVSEPKSMSKGSGAMAAGPALFAELLKSEANRPAMNRSPALTQAPLPSKAPQAAAAQQPVMAQQPLAARPPMGTTAPTVAASAYASSAQQQASVRAQIRSRLEGLKPL